MTDRRHDNLLRLPEVRARCKLSRTTIYRKMNAGTFPRSIRISEGVTAWYESDIDTWIANPMEWRDVA